MTLGTTFTSVHQKKSMVALQERISHFTHLQCSQCEKKYPADEVISFASCDRCEKNLLCSIYEQTEGITPADINIQERSMWRYFSMLPVFDKRHIVSLGEGFTPILKLERIAKKLDLPYLSIKDESLNPTGSFKARGMSIAISKAKELGI